MCNRSTYSQFFSCVPSSTKRMPLFIDSRYQQFPFLRCSSRLCSIVEEKIHLSFDDGGHLFPIFPLPAPRWQGEKVPFSRTFYCFPPLSIFVLLSKNKIPLILQPSYRSTMPKIPIFRCCLIIYKAVFIPI